MQKNDILKCQDSNKRKKQIVYYAIFIKTRAIYFAKISFGEA